MGLGAFYREIATLFAGKIIDESARLQMMTGDKKLRREIDKEWKRIKDSREWLDGLIVERVMLDTKKKP